MNPVGMPGTWGAPVAGTTGAVDMAGTGGMMPSAGNGGEQPPAREGVAEGDGQDASRAHAALDAL